MTQIPIIAPGLNTLEYLEKPVNISEMIPRPKVNPMQVLN